ncbi:MAG: hypothetical protein QG652_1180 [Pseudomonadota bacterium]|nr:hypothetical protein [Pseudomonadota bacterium]
METGFRSELSSQLPTTPARRIDTGPGQSVTDTSPDSDRDKKADEQAHTTQREEQRIVQALAARDREVRAHESAHIAAGRQYVISGPNYTYQQGPDGRNYAIGGEVQLDVSEEEEPQASLDKAETVRRAALAPAEPSAQDRQVAAQASQMAAQARLAIAMERRQAMQTGQSDERGTRANAQEFAATAQTEMAQQVNEYV